MTSARGAWHPDPVGKSDYDLHHEVLLYRAATLPIQHPHVERLALSQLPNANVDMHMTLVVPPVSPLQPDWQIRERLATLDRGVLASMSSEP